MLAASLKPDVIALCESWLSDNISDSEIHLSGYVSYRCDRCDGRKGGRVCVYVSNTLRCEEVPYSTSKPNSIECVSLIMRDIKILLIVIYISPNLKSSLYRDITDHLIEIIDEITCSLPDLKIIIAGDLNQFPTQPLEQHLDMIQIVDFPTRGNATLDKILLDRRLITSIHSPEPNISTHCNNPDNALCAIHPEIGNSDHRSILLKSINLSSRCPQLRKVYDYRASHMISFRAYLGSFPWHHFYRAPMSVEEKCNLLHQKIGRASCRERV